MPFADDLSQLTIIAEEAEQEGEWQDLAAYFKSRSVGLRKEAFTRLKSFLDGAVDWPFHARLRLTRWIADRRKRLFDDHILLPAPLLTKLVSPTIFEWVNKEPANAEAHFLTAILADHATESARVHKWFHLRQALALNPAYDDARAVLVFWLISNAEYNQHHWPGSYLGDVDADLRELQEAGDVADNIADTHRRGRLQAEVLQLREIALTWQAFLKSGHTDFGEWCAQQGVDIDSTI